MVSITAASRSSMRGRILFWHTVEPRELAHEHAYRLTDRRVRGVPMTMLVASIEDPQ
nr:hypothetical protein [Acidiferrobacter sp.]